eukprot:TRINITY_DN11761_c0_g1_i1.p1 TRINITY_DN11761_c0_g1~~TRINITY_DN11761_c0_g1_i1.p1  ORF type:complete len:307 (+),score=47.10 TRINITY_DN11761_c0_g1_i1:105-1025(+)
MASSKQQKPPAKHFKLTKLCRFYAQGTCDRGSFCTFAHTMDEVREQPDFSKTRLCHDFMKLGRCDAGSACKFAHGRKELRNRKGAWANVASSTPAGCKQGKAALEGTRTHNVPASVAPETQGVLAPGAVAMPRSKVPDLTPSGIPLAAHLLALRFPMHEPSHDRSSDTESVWSRRSSVDHQRPPFMHTLSSGSTSSDIDKLSFVHTLSGATSSSVETSSPSTTSWAFEASPSSTTPLSFDMSPASTTPQSLETSPSETPPGSMYFFQRSADFWKQHGVILKNTFIDQVTQMDAQSLRRCSSAPVIR